MYRIHRILGVCLCLTLWVPVDVLAAATKPLPGESRFFPLKDAPAADVTTENGVRVVRERPTLASYRSDRSEREQGMMRIDRYQSPAARQVSPLIIRPAESSGASAPATIPDVVKPTEVSAQPTATTANLGDDVLPESDDIEGLRETNDPVLALFDEGSGDGELLSFADAMRGKSSRRLWMWPLPSQVAQNFTSGYGPRKDPFHGKTAFHGGIDIAAEVGTSVLAAAEGEVIEVENDARFGKYIGIRHGDGAISRYGHLSQQHVREGQRVRAGQTIGAVGSTGRSTGAHLDFRVSRNGVRFDPLSVLSIPHTVALNGVKVPPAEGSRPKIASNALPKRAMVIKVSE